MEHQEALTSFTAAFIDELAEQGVRDVVISPGSRSTPLAILIHAHPRLKGWMNVDERSAGFFALGIAKQSQRPVALLCSSGTATANYYPAVIEAKYGRVPLVVLTADRPHELRGYGAPQTIDQIKLYGDHVKWFQEMPIPEYDETLWRYARNTAKRAVDTAAFLPQGPVHLNFPFREPLVPNIKQDHLWHYGKIAALDVQKEAVVSLTDGVYEQLANDWEKVSRPLIVVGPHRIPGLNKAVLALAKGLGAPILADPLSGLRYGLNGEENHVIDSYDALLKDVDIRKKLQADGIIRIGANPVSKPLTQYINGLNLSVYTIVDEAPEWRDPNHQATAMLHVSPVDFSEKFLRNVENQEDKKMGTEWLANWQKANDVAKDTLAHFMEETPWFEGHVVTTLNKFLQDDAYVFASNSMPIRDVDTFLLNQPLTLDVVANRGANGIDGVVSTAMGLSTGNKPTYLIIGDLAFFHDMNGLMVAKHYQLNVTIIVVNNNGGGIFSFLPQAQEAEEAFEVLFGTPLDYDIETVAQLYNAHYYKAHDVRSFEQALQQSQAQKGIKIIEAKTNRPENVQAHRKLWEAIRLRVQREINCDY
ncbi:2-succinyl-5-enolpyruvyl-6-hydroxy-3-cyclohexene-1-carboxylate synthase [Pullulanibacillus pueri]|uniref:2-succinyl-5-enolpyruvyl-6-hydroxy-3-cyclohexene-1-carboxylate synthase n=1 Tax=Pullulanibacillus pueri TaxID=1437324 RepID=A0A8J2ZY02_9BACL|nr:2-succinyl-5-enolpyruvyl-6-hydroxy-3-cyclohexene-1-carboxylic-acid synthase [Pullulanibacillus pueri]MBM7680497.1 2-succinyl-5-enolpyruvyl-6-hydroxy-3-cyclohexene-1-carboxylate synthase [Pullulanibacillus pueri]GGH86031.1 2-succinyl-5-enolpyruvyl-6-hydroxy-3-cyclohexene-1-carboxylate synthase [Pullulanibacillus pueri]